MATILVLAGANTYQGTTNISSSSGAILVANSSGLGNAANTENIAGGGQIYLENGASPTMTGTLTLNDGDLFGNSTSNTWTGPITLTSGAANEISAAFGDLVINGVISGGDTSTHLILKGPSTTEFRFNNTYSGATVVEGGNLQIDSPSGLGAGGAGNGTTVTAGGSLLLDFPSGGTLQDGSGNAEQLTLSGTGVGNAGALQTIGSGTVIIPGAITLNGVADVSVAAGTLLANGAVLDGSSSGDLIKLGAATMVLANTSATASNYSGGTEIQAGILLDETATLNAGLGTGNVQVDNNATLQLGYSPGTVGISIANNIVFEGVTPAAGADGSLEQLSSGGAVDDFITGNLQFLADPASQVPIAVDGGAGADSAGDELALTGNLITPGGSGTGGGFVQNAPLATGATPQLNGSLLLTGASTFGGTTSVDRGELVLDGGAGVIEVPGALVIGEPSPSTVTFTSAGVDDAGLNEIAASAAVTVNPDGGLAVGIETIGTLNVIGGAQIDIVDMVPGATLTLTGDVTATGYVDAAGNFHAAQIDGAGKLALNATGGGNRTFTVNQPATPPTTYEADLVIAAVVEDDSTGSAPSSLTLLGNGVMSLLTAINGPSADNTYTGATTVQGGTLEVDDSQPQSAVTVAPAAGASAALVGAGTVGAVTFNTGTAGNTGATLGPGDGPTTTGVIHTGNVTLDAGTVFMPQLNGPTAGSGYSQLVSSGTVNLAGATLDLGLGAVFSPGATFTLIQAAVITGTFAGVPNGAVLSENGWSFQINYTATTVTAAAVVNPTTENITVDVAQINEPITLQMVVQFPPGTTSVNGTFTFDYPAAGGDPEVTTVAVFNPTTGQATGVVTVTGLPLGIVPIVGAFFGSYAGPSGGPVVLPPAPVPQVPIAQPQVVGSTIVLNADGSLNQLTPETATTQTLSPAGTIASVSVISANGGPVVFAITTNGNGLYEHSSGGWGQISPASFQQISAATDAAGNAVVFGILGAGAGALADSLWQYVGGVWSEASAGSFQEVSAAATSAGPVAFAIVNGSNNLWEYLPNGVWIMASAGSFQQVSAGINAEGQATAYGILGPGAGAYANSLWEYNGGTWGMLSAPGTILGVSAGGPDTTFAITAGGSNLWRHNDAGWSQTSSGSFTQLSTSAAAGASGRVVRHADGRLAVGVRRQHAVGRGTQRRRPVQLDAVSEAKRPAMTA